jgi:hypothetical protein
LKWGEKNSIPEFLNLILLPPAALEHTESAEVLSKSWQRIPAKQTGCLAPGCKFNGRAVNALIPSRHLADKVSHLASRRSLRSLEGYKVPIGPWQAQAKADRHESNQ